MQIHKNSKIEACCGKDPRRRVLTHPHISNINGKPHLCATDGKCLAYVPVILEDGDTPGYVNSEALKQARKLEKHEDVLHIEANGSLKLKDGSTLPRFGADGSLSYPNVDLVIPDPKDVKWSIAFDVDLLKNLADALGTTHVTLKVIDEVSPITVLPSGRSSDKKEYDRNGRGVFMPMRLG